MAENPLPLGGHGGDRKSEEAKNQVKDINLIPAKQTGPTANYLNARIAKDRPDILKRMRAGIAKVKRQPPGDVR